MVSYLSLFCMLSGTVFAVNSSGGASLGDRGTQLALQTAAALTAVGQAALQWAQAGDAPVGAAPEPVLGPAMELAEAAPAVANIGNRAPAVLSDRQLRPRRVVVAEIPAPAPEITICRPRASSRMPRDHTRPARAPVVEDIHAVDADGNTSLHRAVQTLCFEAVRRLLSASANPNLQNELGRTPLHLLVLANVSTGQSLAIHRLKIAERLFQHGADVNILDLSGSSA
ncbi:MAG TPA: ankyrin repeat domain-containing protein, partial [Opitutales bacterium]|nr:ankyrin repeat domain-containing protein [Opitutales bacterium]